MAEGRQRDTWHRTALLAAPLWQQAFPRRSKQPYQVSDFDPFAQKSKPAPLGVKELRRYFK